jgi:hypothetical protein
MQNLGLTDLVAAIVDLADPAVEWDPLNSILTVNGSIDLPSGEIFSVNSVDITDDGLY